LIGFIILSGCNQISDVFLTDKERFIGTWNSEGIWLDVPTVIVFSSGGTCKIEAKIGTVNFSISDGKWDLNNGILTIEIVDLIPATNYTYQFSDENKTLTITEVESTDSYILRKQ
jgi:hypothetical protein